MRRLVRFVGATRPEIADAGEAPAPSQASQPAVGDPAPDRPLDVAPSGSEQLADANIVDAVGREV